jgi:LAS superfamily LD-carboxypeptidase LdcB/putative cell wall-binding protein
MVIPLLRLDVRSRILAAMVAVAALVFATGLASASPASAAGGVSRIYGADRFETAAAISKAAFPQPGGPIAFVANGVDFPDSLAVGPVAARLGGPVLLATSGGLPDSTRSELMRLAPQKIVIVGGAGAVGTTVARALQELAPVVDRVAGADRYETSRLIAAYGFPEGTPTVVLATGRDFPDALSGAALAAHYGAPLILVDGTAATTDDPTKEVFAALAPAEVIVLGGTAVVSSEVARGAAAATGAALRRIAGTDRFDTSALIAGEFGSYTRAYISTGSGFADATAVVPLAARDRAPVVLSPAICSPGSTRAALTRPSVTSRVLLGGPMVLRGLAGSAHPCQSIRSASSTWVLVNKRIALSPLKYAPGDLRNVRIQNAGGGALRAEAATALEKMDAASRSSGVGALGNYSAYRSYTTQQSVHQAHINNLGVAGALLVSARPGHSEHQTGLAVDLVACSASGCGSPGGFGSSRQGKWVAENAHRYGFVVRYRPGQASITGYVSEPWHLRYVGVALASDYTNDRFTSLEQYFGSPAAPTY